MSGESIYKYQVMSLNLYLDKLHEFLMRDMAALKVNLHGQKEREEELVSLIEAPTSVPPDSDSKEADDVTDSYLGVVAAV